MAACARSAQDRIWSLKLRHMVKSALVSTLAFRLMSLISRV